MKSKIHQIFIVMSVLVFITICCGLPAIKLPGLDKIGELIPGGDSTIEDVEPATMPLKQETVRQWGATAKASSEYSSSDWAAHQATGAPDTPDCGDYETAWASAEQYSVEWLEVSFAKVVIPTEVNIYESHTPTQIVKVEILDDSGVYHEVYTGTPQGTSCPYVLSIPIQNASYQATAVKLTVDQSQLNLAWDEIDAVELVGIASTFGEYASDAIGIEPPNQSVPMGATSDDIASWTWTNFTSADGLPDDNVQALSVDEAGAVWIGTKEGGVSSCAGGKFANYTVEDGLGSNNVKAILAGNDGKIWAGTANGLSVFNGNHWITYTKDDGLVHNIVNALALTNSGAIWIATESGISYFDGNAWTNYVPDDGPGRTNVKGVAVASNGDVWFATFNGVSRFDGGNWDYFNIEDGLSLDVFTSAGADPDGSVWFGTSGEAADQYRGGDFISHKSEMGPTVYVKAITAGLDGAMWFGTEGDGVYRYDGKEWEHFLKEDSGLVYNWVDAAAVAPDGALWFATRKNGITRFGP